MTTKTETATNPGVPAVIPAPKDLAKHLTIRQLAEVLSHIEVSPEMAAVSFKWAKKGAEYMRGGAQSSVNLDFDREYQSSRAKGLDADGSAVAVSVKTRKTFEKLGASLERAANLAGEIITVEAENNKK